MSFQCNCVNVLGPEQIIRDVCAQDLEAVDSDHCHSANEDRYMDEWLYLPEVNNHLLGLDCINITQSDYQCPSWILTPHYLPTTVVSLVICWNYVRLHGHVYRENRAGDRAHRLEVPPIIE